MKLKELDDAEVRQVYRTHLTQDFPAAERKPLRAIRSLRRRGLYDCYAMTQGETVLSYAFFCQRGDWCLLDYFAVCAPFRGKGTGTRMMEALRFLLPHMGILAEVEDPGQAATPGEKHTRLRRIAFYERLGFLMTGIRVRLFSVDYRIMAWRTEYSSPSDGELYDVLAGLYQAMMGEHTGPFLRMSLDGAE